MFARVAAKMAEAAHPPFDFCVVDEAQDIGVAELRLAALGGSRPNSLFVAGELGQRIFQTLFSWRALSVDVRGRSHTLRISYRTSHQITVLRDGIWLGPANMVMRPQNTFNLDRVEVLRGPSSVFNGQGAVAGTVNAITEQVAPTATTQWNALLSYGRFNTYQTSVGVNGPLSDSLWYRLDFSGYGSDGHVDRMSPELFQPHRQLAVAARPARRAEVQLRPAGRRRRLVLRHAAVADRACGRTARRHYDDDRGGIDARTRFLNYNVEDAVNDSRQLLLRSDAEVRLSDRVTLRNTLYGFGADRDWQNGDGFAYCPALVDVCRRVGEVQRYWGYFWLDHDQRLVGDRLFLDVRTPTAAGENRATIGFEHGRQPDRYGVRLLVRRVLPGTYGSVVLLRQHADAGRPADVLRHAPDALLALAPA